MRLVLLTLVLGIGSVAPALAQTPDYRTYWPLTPGNMWVYARTDQDCRFTSCTTEHSTEVWTVLDSATVATGRLPRIRVGQSGLGSVECLVSFEPSAPGGALGRTFLMLNATGDAPCDVDNPRTWWASSGVHPGYYVAAVYEAVRPVVIGDVSYGERRTSWGLADTGSPDISTSWYWVAADSLGLLTSSRSGHVSGGFNNVSSLTLQWAQVDGQTYGTFVSDDAGPHASGLALVAGRNPTAGPLTVRFVLPASAAARLAVIDALGREVRTLDLGARPAGTSTEAVDLSGLAPGVYTVRLTAGDAAATARVSVVR